MGATEAFATTLDVGHWLAAHEFSRRAQVGMVGMNVPIPVPTAK